MENNKTIKENSGKNFLQTNSKTVYRLMLFVMTLTILMSYLDTFTAYTEWFTPPVALFMGLVFALVCGEAYPKFNKKISKYLLQYSVVGLGFGMSIQESLQSGKDGMAFTIVSVVGTLIIGMLIGYKALKVDKDTSYLISSGTAICGGSAIAAVGPVLGAKESSMSVALGTVFILNAIALFIFPEIGHMLGLSQEQFGTWAAIAIHDTSSVVGAGQAYGAKALEVATTIKLTRALWIIPVAFATALIFKKKDTKVKIPWFTPPVALFMGLVFALVCGEAYPKFNKKISKYLLQYSVVGLGFGMSIQESLQSGKDGMAFTIVSVVGTLIIGMLIGYKALKVDKDTSYLISSGTAICGGSAIAAVGPVLGAKESSMSVALGTVFILNAIALFIFPEIGHMLGLSQEQFGTWAAIAIHDTSSVVGAGQAYGDKALEVATTIKLTRALWIIPVAFATALIFKKKDTKVKIPWFIFFFVLAMIFNSYVLSNSSFGQSIGEQINLFARKTLTVTLFFIGASLSRNVIKSVGFKAMLQGVLLWIVISAASLLYILYFVH